MPKKRKNRKKKSRKDESKKEENNNIEENGNEIKDEKNEGEEDNDLYKITNIEYEKFIKENDNLFEYVSKSKPQILIQSDKFKSEIDLKSDSLIKIMTKANLINEFKIYIKKQIISEELNFERYSIKSLTTVPELQTYIKNLEYFNIGFPSEKEEGNIININNNSIQKIFSLLGLNYLNDIFTYLDFTITQVSYKYKENMISYKINDKNLKKLMKENKIFYILIKNNNKEIYIPLSNYSTQKIFNLFNKGKDAKYLLIKYKIKNDDLKENNNIFLKKLINESDVKNILIKYKLNSNKETILKNNKLNNIQEINIFDLNNFLFPLEQKLSNIIQQISNKKKEIFNKIENIQNQIMSIFINSEQKFINRQYIKLIESKNKESIDIFDYTNKKINLTKNDFKNIEEENIYVEIYYDGKNYLVNKNKILKIYDSWKILNQKEFIDVIDTNEFYDNKINIELLNMDIVEQNLIKEIHENTVKKNKFNSFVEYAKSLPRKSSYTIKYKIKVEKIPKPKKNNNV